MTEPQSIPTEAEIAEIRARADFISTQALKDVDRLLAALDAAHERIAELEKLVRVYSPDFELERRKEENG